MSLVPVAIENTTSNYQSQQATFLQMDPHNLNAEDVGKVINVLQEEIRIIKL